MLYLHSDLSIRLANGSDGQVASGAAQPVSLPKPLLKNMVVREGTDLLEQLREAVQVRQLVGGASVCSLATSDTSLPVFLQESCKEDERLMEELSAPIGDLLEAFKDVTPDNVGKCTHIQVILM